MKHSKLGFSLVELMVVVGIMGILAAIAVPRFQSYQARAKKMEAINMLNQIYSLEAVYFAEHSQYEGTNGETAYGRTSCSTGAAAPAWANNIGFQITPCVSTNPPVFDYTITADTSTFEATATDTKNIISNNNCTITITQDKVIADNCH